MLEMLAVTFDGAHTAEKTLSDLRANRDDPWLSEVSVIEHDVDGRYSVKAKNPSVEDSKVGTGAALGGLTGVFIGAIGGPFGLFLWGTLGAMTGAAVGASAESPFKYTVDALKARLAPGASMLVLVGETASLDGLATAVSATDEQTIREPLTSEQAKALTEAAAG